MRRSLVGSVSAILAVVASPLPVAGARPAPTPSPMATAIFAGGCYWGVESVFRHVRGVTSAVSGFAVPEARGSSMAPVRPAPGYVEAVRVQYDPAQVSYQELLQVFFLVAHDPTQVGHQGPDVGAEYRSVVFIADSVQGRAVRAYLDRLAAERAFPAPIVTELAALKHFTEAEPDQQNYAATHERDVYIVTNDAPKLVELKRRYPRLYKE